MGNATDHRMDGSAAADPAIRRPEPEFQTWALQHHHERRVHAAQLAQITAHHDLNPAGDAMHQLQAWAQRQARQKHLHDSAMAQIRQG